MVPSLISSPDSGRQQTRHSLNVPSTPYRKLRVLLVDDNHINLSVLSTLLKRRFNYLLDGPPVTVDSGLKAIQLLRTHVFDCILMDIQMPFLSGLEAAIRIRNVEDGVLSANRDAHIVAVTTAIGDEPELAYRRAGMDGMIGKPVRFQDIQHYLSPLAHEAHHSAEAVEPFLIDGEHIMPPLPQTGVRQGRLFYLPADATIRAPRPDICMGADFEKMLRAQTRASLRKDGAFAIARTATWCGPHSQSRRQNVDEGSEKNVNSDRIIEEEAGRGDSDAGSRSNSCEKLEPMQLQTLPSHGGSASADSSPTRPSMGLSRRSRGGSMMINKRLLSQQIAREIENMEQNSDLSDTGAKAELKVQDATKALGRPKAVHRTSSPGWLLTTSATGSKSSISVPTSPVSHQLVSSPTEFASLASGPVHTSPLRPNWLVAMKGQRNPSSCTDSTAGSSSSELTSTRLQERAKLDGSSSLLLSLRRDSERSNDSVASDVSTDVTTPSNDSPAWPASKPRSNYISPHVMISRGTAAASSSSSTADPWSSDEDVEAAQIKASNVKDVAGRKHYTHRGKAQLQPTLHLQTDKLTARKRGLHISEAERLSEDIQRLDLTR